MTGEHILVVDDDDVHRETVAEALRAEGYTVETARDGVRGLASLMRTKPALVLLDMRMPLFDGWDFVGEIERRGLKRPRILVMTAAIDAQRAAIQIHADGWVGKPFDLEELLPEVARLSAPAA
jgi:DNA-binding response OmpR family regulator